METKNPVKPVKNAAPLLSVSTHTVTAPPATECSTPTPVKVSLHFTDNVLINH